jgi:hypothetical protein
MNRMPDIDGAGVIGGGRLRPRSQETEASRPAVASVAS